VSKAIRSARVLAFADLGMEAIHEFVVENMPVTVAVDSSGASIHETGPSQWRRPVMTRSGVAVSTGQAPARAEPSREAMMTPPSLLGSADMRKDPMMRC
jgi:hypothetical protein